MKLIIKESVFVTFFLLVYLCTLVKQESITEIFYYVIQYLALLYDIKLNDQDFTTLSKSLQLLMDKLKHDFEMILKMDTCDLNLLLIILFLFILFSIEQLTCFINGLDIKSHILTNNTNVNENISLKSIIPYVYYLN